MVHSRPRIHSRSTPRSSIGRLGASCGWRPVLAYWWKGRRSSWIAHVSVGLYTESLVRHPLVRQTRPGGYVGLGGCSGLASIPRRALWCFVAAAMVLLLPKLVLDLQVPQGANRQENHVCTTPRRACGRQPLGPGSQGVRSLLGATCGVGFQPSDGRVAIPPWQRIRSRWATSVKRRSGPGWPGGRA